MQEVFYGDLFDKIALEFDTDLDNMDSVSKDNNDGFWSENDNVDDTRVFNHKDRTAYFRIDVNPYGLNFPQYKADLKTDALAEKDFDHLSVTDQLPEHWKLVPVDESGAPFALYKAKPGTIYWTDYSISFGGSSSFKSEIIEPNAQNRLSEAEIQNVVDFDAKNMRWNFKNLADETYMILVKAQLDEAMYQELVKNGKQQEEGLSCTNTAKFLAKDEPIASAGKQILVKPLVLEKEKPVWLPSTKIGEYSQDWTIYYRPLDVADYQDVVLVDELDENLVLPLDKNGQPDLSFIQIQRSSELQPDGTYANYQDFAAGTTASAEQVQVSYDAKKHELRFALPNATDGKLYSYKILYRTQLQPVNLGVDTIYNRVKLQAKNATPGNEGYVEESLKENKAWAALQGIPFFVFQKVNAKDGSVLPGATFEFVRDGEVVATKVSNAKGLLYIINPEDGTYTMRETNAPENFEVRADVHFTIQNGELVLADGQDADIKGAGTLQSPVLVSNTEKPETPPEESSEKPPEPETPPEPEKPNEPPEKPQTTTETKETPKTGDVFVAPLWIALAVLSMVILFVLRKRARSKA